MAKVNRNSNTINDADPRQKMFRPYGNANKALYDKSPIVGICGPAGTGKSRLFIEKLHLIAEKYPGARILMARKTRESLTEAALVTYEDKVLPDGHPINPSTIRRSHRQQYQYPNGSVIIVCGLDKPQKIMSTEYDIIYIQEAIECDQDDIEMLTTRLRNGIVPYQQLIFDCNPDRPGHWIYQGYLKGKWPLYKSMHEDNPTLWEENLALTEPNDEFPNQDENGRVGRWTSNGKRYINVLEGLTGPRYYRLRHGKWVGAEGAIYDTFDVSIHVYDDSNSPWGGGLPPRQWRRIWVVDFGYTHPMVIQKYAIDPDGRMYMYREHYHTKMLVQDMCYEVLDVAGYRYDERLGIVRNADTNVNDADSLPIEVIGDWDAEGRATFEKYTGIHITPAIKNITGGIQAVQTRLGKPGFTKARIFFYRDALYKIDQELAREMKPFNTLQEFDSYVWGPDDNGKRAELPAPKQSDHGMDNVRYAVAHEDGIIDSELKATDVPISANADLKLQVVSVPMNKVLYTPGNSLIGRTKQSGHNQTNKTRFPRRSSPVPRTTYGTNEWNPGFGNYGR